MSVNQVCPHFWAIFVCTSSPVLSLYNASLPPSPVSWCACQSSLSCQMEPKIELRTSCTPIQCGYMALVTLVSWCFLLQLNAAELHTYPLPAHGWECVWVCEQLCLSIGRRCLCKRHTATMPKVQLPGECLTAAPRNLFLSFATQLCDFLISNIWVHETPDIPNV